MNAKTITLGIDPGSTGAVAFLMDHRIISVFDMPLMERAKRSYVDPCTLARTINKASNVYSRIYGQQTKIALFACVENVHSMPSQGVASTFLFGYSLGAIEGVLAGIGIEYVMVNPRKWKSHFNLVGKKKQTSYHLVNALYPDNSYVRYLKDIGRAEAILIARYAVDTIAGERHEQ